MGKPRAYTAEECREMFLDHLRGVCEYWSTVAIKPENMRPGQTEANYRVSGALFSTLVMFDGGTLGTPALDISPSPHPDDKGDAIREGRNWWPEGLVFNDVQLHEFWHEKKD